MKTGHGIYFRSLMAAIFLVGTAVAGCARADQQASSEAISKLAPDQRASSELVANPAPGGGPGEGIKVHGRWTLEVSNPDGSVAERLEFDNALNSPWGTGTLAYVLGRQNSIGGWTVSLFQGGATSPFMDANSSATPGLIRESSDVNNWPYLFKTLTVVVPEDGPNQHKLVLSGTAIAQRNGAIGAVGTSVSRLSGILAPSNAYVSVTSFTDAILPNTVNLNAGQQLAVTVVISFS